MVTREAQSGFTISTGPITSTTRHRAELQADELPAHFAEPLLLALARNPRTLFVCWSVDWPAAFTKGFPRDRSAHLKIKSGADEKIIAVEPMRGSCYVEDLAPGETYTVEIGYYAPQDSWNTIVSGNEVMMPFDDVAEEDEVDVATIPFHLAFQRIMEAFRAENGANIADALANLQSRAAETPKEADTEILRALGISAADVRATKIHRGRLMQTPAIRDRAAAIFGFGQSSPSHGFGAGS